MEFEVPRMSSHHNGTTSGTVNEDASRGSRFIALDRGCSIHALVAALIVRQPTFLAERGCSCNTTHRQDRTECEMNDSRNIRVHLNRPILRYDEEALACQHIRSTVQTAQLPLDSSSHLLRKRASASASNSLGQEAQVDFTSSLVEREARPLVGSNVSAAYGSCKP